MKKGCFLPDTIYVYSDRNFNHTGKGVAWSSDMRDIGGSLTVQQEQYNCSFKRGWNIMYQTGAATKTHNTSTTTITYTTEKPSGTSTMRWYSNCGGLVID